MASTGNSWTGSFESLRNYMNIPVLVLEDLIKYVSTGRGGGDLLTALVTNDLMGVYRHADLRTIQGLWAIVTWLYNRCPQQAIGSPENVAEWRAHGGYHGLITGDAALASQVVADWVAKAKEGTVLGETA